MLKIRKQKKTPEPQLKMPNYNIDQSCKPLPLNFENEIATRKKEGEEGAASPEVSVRKRPRKTEELSASKKAAHIQPLATSSTGQNPKNLISTELGTGPKGKAARRY